MFGPKKQDFWSKINVPLHFENTRSASLSKIGHDFRKHSGSKIEVRKNVFFYKKWFLELIFLNDLFWKKNPLIFDIGN